MSRRELRGDLRVDYPPPPPSKCAKFLYYTWRLCSVVFSHFVMISLVVAYCILGAVTFEKLEADYEREVKANISQIRANTSHSIFNMTSHVGVLSQTNWTADVVDMLKDFENAILREMKVRGWDGNESTDHIQWTFTGALFYSIIVITTIGYGHIAPKTQTGKVVTILYAILGIPLMLLCLSNIGDVMASSFRFLYWRVCCYVCTRPPKRRHRHHGSRRSMRGSTRRRRPPLERAYSDNECRSSLRYRESGYASRSRHRTAPAATRPRSQPSGYNAGYGHGDYEDEDRSPGRFDRRNRDPYPEDDQGDDLPRISLPLNDLEAALKELDNYQMRLSISKPDLRSKSLPRPPKSKPDYGPRKDFDDRRNNDYDDNHDLYEMHDLHDVDYENYKERKALEEREKRRRGPDEFYHRDRGYDPEDEDYEFDAPSTKRPWHNKRNDRGRSELYPRERSPEYERRRRARSAFTTSDLRSDPRGDPRRLRRLYTVEDTRPGRYTPSPERDEYSDEMPPRRSRPPPQPAWGSRQMELYADPPDTITKEEIKPVPIWLCVCLVASYIVAGTFLFKQWEGWAYLDAAYFCFITLTTIGFGDFVPAQGQSGATSDAVHSIALCSLYLLFGIALLAMSFNLVQEEVRANVADIATKLGIIKPRDAESDDEY